MVTRDGVIAVYMTANRKNGTLYIGVTSNLAPRIHQHKTGELKGSPRVTAPRGSFGIAYTTLSSKR